MPDSGLGSCWSVVQLARVHQRRGREVGAVEGRRPHAEEVAGRVHEAVLPGDLHDARGLDEVRAGRHVDGGRVGGPGPGDHLVAVGGRDVDARADRDPVGPHAGVRRRAAEARLGEERRAPVRGVPALDALLRVADPAAVTGGRDAQGRVALRLDGHVAAGLGDAAVRREQEDLLAVARRRSGRDAAVADGGAVEDPVRDRPDDVPGPVRRDDDPRVDAGADGERCGRARGRGRDEGGRECSQGGDHPDRPHARTIGGLPRPRNVEPQVAF